MMRWLALPLWVRFLAAMCLKWAHKTNRLSPEAERYGRVVVAFGYALDCFYNITWATIEFRDWPRELLVTQRLKRYKYGRAYRIRRDGWKLVIERVTVPAATGKRLEKTEWYAQHMLDPFEVDGKHI